MTVPAHFASLRQLLHITHASSLHKLLIQLRMTADAVIHYYLAGQRFCHRRLPLSMGYKICRVLQSVHRLEAVLQRKVLVGHMAVVTRGVSPVR